MLTSRFGALERNSNWNQHVRLLQSPRALPPDEPEKPSEAQRSEIKRLEQQLDCWKKALEELLSLAREYQEFTIEKVLARDDVKVAFDVITGKMRRWLKGPLLL